MEDNSRRNEINSILNAVINDLEEASRNDDKYDNISLYNKSQAQNYLDKYTKSLKHAESGLKLIENAYDTEIIMNDEKLKEKFDEIQKLKRSV